MLPFASCYVCTILPYVSNYVHTDCHVYYVVSVHCCHNNVSVLCCYTVTMLQNAFSICEFCQFTGLAGAESGMQGQTAESIAARREARKPLQKVRHTKTLPKAPSGG